MRPPPPTARLPTVRRCLPTAALARMTLAAALLASCGGGQSTDDVVGAGVQEPDSVGCQPTRTPIPLPGADLLEPLQGLFARYPVAGRWGSSSHVLDHTPTDVAFAGELALERREGELTELAGCELGVEVPVRVAFRTGDGALAETLDGVAVLLDDGRATTVDGRPAPFFARVRASLDLGAVAGSFSFAEDPRWAYGRASLFADVTSFASRGRLLASPEPRQPPSDPSERAVAPAPGDLLHWPSADVCDGSGGEQPLYPAPTPARQELEDAIEVAAGQTYPARYADGSETRVSVVIDPPPERCSEPRGRLHTRARLATDDGRIDVSIAVALDPGYALLHYNERTEVPWAYPPPQVEERIGRIGVDAAEHAHVGIEAWFDLTPQPAGWLKVLGYSDGDCTECHPDGGCTECRHDARVEVLSLFIGAQAAALRP